MPEISDRLAEIRELGVAWCTETDFEKLCDAAADYCETLKKLALQEGYTRGWEERARKAESELEDTLTLARLAAAEEALQAIEVIRKGAAGPKEPLPYTARADIGRIARDALAANTETPA